VVDAATVKHADATSSLEAGKPRSLWGVATTAATVFRIVTHGAAATIKPLFRTCSGILVSDRATVFRSGRFTRRSNWASRLSDRGCILGGFGIAVLPWLEPAARHTAMYVVDPVTARRGSFPGF
jgi:hypothetical protein